MWKVGSERRLIVGLLAEVDRRIASLQSRQEGGASDFLAGKVQGLEEALRLLQQILEELESK